MSIDDETDETGLAMNFHSMAQPKELSVTDAARSSLFAFVYWRFQRETVVEAAVSVLLLPLFGFHRILLETCENELFEESLFQHRGERLKERIANVSIIIFLQLELFLICLLSK